MTPVYVYQMGECGSTAIVEALRSAGLEAAHTHELGAALLAKRAHTLMMEPASELLVEHAVGQLGQNIRFTNEIQHRRATGDRVQIITVARHPIDWYWSFLSQTFEGQKHALLDSDLIAAFEDAWDRGAESELSPLHRAIVDACVLKINHGMRLAADAITTATGNSLAERILNARRSLPPEDRHLAALGFDVLLPLTWFSQNLEPLTGMTVFEQPLTANGSSRMANEWCDLLVLSYERLATLVHVIAEFVGRPVTLPVANPPRTKPYAAELAAVRQRAPISGLLADVIWTSPYCRHFGYTPSPYATAATSSDALDVGLSSIDVTRGTTPLSAWITSLRCPSCRSPSLVAADTTVRCGSCRVVYAISQGVIDFVAGRGSTKCDDFDYDALYMISDQPDPLFDELRQSAAVRWPTSLGRVLEVGAGTGGQTLSLIASGAVQSLAVTDISPKMLKICRERLIRTKLEPRQPIVFLTYGAAESPFRDASFDSCFGSSVVHHILDVGAFLTEIVRVLRPGGVAFFVEPNARFHQALGTTLADILAELLHENPDNPDLPWVMNWLAEVNLNLTHSGDLEFLAGREDKHLFRAEEITALAQECGFGEAEMLPLRLDPSGCQALDTYLTQCGITQQSRLDILARAAAIGPRYFSLLPPRDLSPSSLLWFRKTKPASAARANPARPQAANLREQALDSVRYHVELRPDHDLCKVHGWAVGSIAPAWLHITVGGETARTPIWLPSTDVHQAFGPRASRLFANGLCARFLAEIPIRSRHATWTATIEMNDGGRVEVTPYGGIELAGTTVLTNAAPAGA